MKLAPAAFAATLRPYIEEAAHETGLAPESIACHWGQESGWYTEGVWQSRPGWNGRNNLGGIMAGGTPQNFANLSDFVAAYVGIIRGDAARYGPIPSGSNLDTTVTDQLNWIAKTDYNGAHHYALNGVWGGELLAIWHDFPGIAGAFAAPAPAAPLVGTLAVYADGHVEWTPAGGTAQPLA